MLSRKRLMYENTMLKYRIAELEERLCPCEEHDWKQIGFRFNSINAYDTQTIYHYKCRRCGKYKEEGDF